MANTDAKQERKVLTLALSQIVQIENSRLTYRSEDMSELMTSMKYRGLLSPIGVRQIAGGKHEVVFGNRRLVAATKLGWEEIDALLVDDAESNEEMLLLNAVENMQRVDVPPMEQGRIFFALQELGLTVNEIAARIGIAPYRVRRILEIYIRTPEKYRAKIVGQGVTASIEGGKMSSSTASSIAALSGRIGLSPKQRNDVLAYGINAGVTNTHIKTMGALVRGGLSLQAAMRAAKDTRIITLSVAIHAKHAKKLEEDHGQSVHKVIYDHLMEERWLGIVGAKPPVRKKRR